MSRHKKIQKTAPAARSSVSPRYFLQRALTSMRQNVVVTLATVATTFLSLLLFALFLLVYVNIERSADRWSEKVQVAAYLDHEPSPQDLQRLVGQVHALGGTRSVSYVSKEEAIARFRARMKGQEALVEGVSPDILPASIEVTLSRNARSGESVATFADRLRKLPGIQDVQYGEEWVRKFEAFLSFFRLVGLLLGTFLALGVFFIVSNTIRLGVYSRRDELELMELVGATRLFIKMPFLIEGGIEGAAGGFFAVAGTAAIYGGLVYQGTNFLSFMGQSGLVFISPLQAAGLVAGGMCAGLAGSLASLRKFVNR